MNSSIIAVIQPGKGEGYQELCGDGGIVFGYRLHKSYTFHEPHYVKVVQFSGTKVPCLISCSFTPPQPVNGGADSLIGTTAVQTNIYVPLLHNTLPFSGYIKLVPLAGEKQFRDAAVARKFTLVLHITPESWLNGSPGHASV